MKKIYVYIVGLVSIISLISAGTVLAASSANYQIDGGKVTSGAGTASSDNYQTDIASNPAAGNVSSDNYSVEGGGSFNLGTTESGEDSEPSTPATTGGGSSVASESTPPEIVSLEVKHVSQTEATVFFHTNEITVAFVAYGENNNFDIRTSAEDSFLMDHNFVLTDLRPATVYKLKVHMFDRHHNVVVTRVYEFTTLPTVEIIPEKVETEQKETKQADEVKTIPEVPITFDPQKNLEEVEETAIVEEELINVFTYVKQEIIDEEGEAETIYIPEKIVVEGEWKALVDSETLLSLPIEIFAKGVSEVKVKIKDEIVLFEYNEDTKGYEALVRMPEDSGEYEADIQVIYTDETYEEVSKIVDVVSYGSVVEKSWRDLFSKEIKSIPGAHVSIYKENADGGWDLWQAGEYNQYNPQVTSDTGNFIFLVPEGNYYVEVHAEGYRDFQTETIEVADKIVAPEIKLSKASKEMNNGWAILLVLAVFIVILYTLKIKK